MYRFLGLRFFPLHIFMSILGNRKYCLEKMITRVNIETLTKKIEEKQKQKTLKKRIRRICSAPFWGGV